MTRYFIVLFSLSLFACESLFNEDDNQYIVLDEHQEKIDVINGIYSRLVDVNGSSYLTLLSRSDDNNIYRNFSFYSEGQSCSGSSSGSIDFAAVSDNIYLNLYKAVISANSLLKQLTESEDSELLGEVYFLRAYCYFKLARLFGTPPLVKDTDVDYLLEKPTYREVYEFIEEDMLSALELLPETYTDARIPGETLHKGAAKAFLAEVYLAMAGFPVNDTDKYAEAAKLAGEVIANAAYYNFALLNDMTDLWKVKNRHNSENIFGLFFSSEYYETENQFSGAFLDYSYSEFPQIIGSSVPEFKFYNTFPDNYRKFITFSTGAYYNESYNAPDTLLNGLRFNEIDPLTDPCGFISNVRCRKWLDPAAFNRGLEWRQWGSSVTLYILRYAQTLLTYAEARARADGPDEMAYEAVNMIRRRANKLNPALPSAFDLSPELKTEQFVDSVVWERAWELCIEPEGRWFDIVRLDLRDELAGFRYPQDVPTVVNANLLNEDWYFYLIPLEDRQLNPNLE